MGSYYVLIQTIPERRESFERLRATLPPWVEPILLGDGYTRTNEQQKIFDGCWSQKRGVGYRWLFIEHSILGTPSGGRWIFVNDYILCLDDDVMPRDGHQSYVEAFEALEKDPVVGWGGFARGGKYHDFYEPTGVQDLCMLHAGMLALRAHVLVGIKDVPNADLLLGVGGNDSLALAHHFYLKNIPLVKSGCAPFYLTETHHDRHAQQFVERTDEVNRAKGIAQKAIGLIADDSLQPRDDRRKRA